MESFDHASVFALRSVGTGCHRETGVLGGRVRGEELVDVVFTRFRVCTVKSIGLDKVSCGWINTRNSGIFLSDVNWVNGVASCFMCVEDSVRDFFCLERGACYICFLVTLGYVFGQFPFGRFRNKMFAADDGGEPPYLHDYRSRGACLSQVLSCG